MNATRYESHFRGKEVDAAVKNIVVKVDVLPPIDKNYTFELPDEEKIFIVTNPDPSQPYDFLYHYSKAKGGWRELGAVPSISTAGTKIIINGNHPSTGGDHYVTNLSLNNKWYKVLAADAQESTYGNYLLIIE